jgi:hypothetical protein
LVQSIHILVSGLWAFQLLNEFALRGDNDIGWQLRYAVLLRDVAMIVIIQFQRHERGAQGLIQPRLIEDFLLHTHARRAPGRPKVNDNQAVGGRRLLLGSFEVGLPLHRLLC